MNERVEHKKAVDAIQQRLTSYACELNYDGVTPEAIHGAKVRIIDTLGALIAGFFGEPCCIARNMAAETRKRNGATVIGTRMKTTLEMAAFANATTARYAELNDAYNLPGTARGHPSDTVTPLLAVAEHMQLGGRDLITSIVLAYEIFLRLSEGFQVLEGFDFTNFGCIGAAAGAGKLLGLSPSQLSHCISMAIVPNNILTQVRRDDQTMFKGVASGQAGRAAVFAALMARAGMEGPHLPFEGEAGWCKYVAPKPFSLGALGGNGTPFKITATQIKLRPTNVNAIGCILAAEKVGPLNSNEVKQVTVEVFKRAIEMVGTGEQCWNPDSKEAADHSIPYVVAASLMDGKVTPHSFNDAHLANLELRALMKKIEIVENPEFSKAFERVPRTHHSRVTVVTRSGERLVGESGGDEDDLATPKSDAQIAKKFRELTEDILGAKRVTAILDRLWHLEDLKNVAEIPPAFVFD